MEEKILTIDKINFTGKWVEFWFKEKNDEPVGYVGFHKSSKAYMLWNAVEKANLENEIHNNGFRGKKLKWIKVENNPNWEIDCFVLDGNDVVSELTDEQHFWITLIARLNDELVNKQIITPTQRGEISKYIRERMVFDSQRKGK